MLNTSRIVNADVIYIGYPKAASTFISRFLENHSDVTVDRDLLTPLLHAPSIADLSTVNAEKPCLNKIHVSIDEMVALSVCQIPEEKWMRFRLIPGSWDKVKDEVVLDPVASALRLNKIHSRAKVLLVIREQTDWLHSAYKHFIRYLPGHQRTFADFCTTPQGIAMLQAGHFDKTLHSYIDVFGKHRVHVLRFEDLVSEPRQFAAELCTFMSISERPIPHKRMNESSALTARIRRRFPIIDQLPSRIKTTLKPIAARLPGKRALILSTREVGMLRDLYAVSNQHADKLLGQLYAEPR